MTSHITAWDLWEFLPDNIYTCMKVGLGNPTGVVGVTKCSSPLSMPPKSKVPLRPLVLLSPSLCLGGWSPRGIR